jgi:hypothetical protein
VLTQKGRTEHWKWNVLAYGWWIVGSFLLWLLAYWAQYDLPIMGYHLQLGSLPLAILTPVLQGIIAWLAFQIVLADQRLPWLIAVTLIGYLLGLFVERYCYVFANVFFRLIPGNTVRLMVQGVMMYMLVIGGSMAVFQVLLLGPTLKRISKRFARAWIAAAIIAAIVAPILMVLFELKYYSPSDLYPSLILSTTASVITGLPLIWLRAQQW